MKSVDECSDLISDYKPAPLPFFINHDDYDVVDDTPGSHLDNDDV